MGSSIVIAALLLPLAVGEPLANPADPRATLAAAQEAYNRRGDPAQAAAAVTLFAAAAAADPSSYEAHWQGARACYAYGTYTLPEERTAERIHVFEDGIGRAKRAVALRPDGVEGHFWLGVLLGVWGEARGVLKSLAVVPEILAAMDTCLRLDPSVEAWGPDRLLGRLYFKLPWFKGGDNQKSRQHLERSLAHEPANELTRLYLADTYRALGMKREAQEQLRHILDTAPDPRWAPEYPWVRAQAEQLLKKLR
jgi:tetratricopeptide (TPR) repeat protein